ncbi:GNAT family N-acetyltransferase [Agrobacterium vitis]|uniref:GNAT family N-acetyltransferase n=1 Tax=Agrobacterium vitis TaxID=373 RepID=A0A1S2E3V0_AGRVI|nr:GNAT family N-acetyltransferase [Agrobacterium vitis]MUO79367.1 GNAT family N-acetyltransferase [Agrobacterium vitis]MUO96192.1 GNAT family N-acetyltransferase [Agrobacterium vitis]MUP05743.1 GNAT family N-acetyltransferase [Agrobacterium vitis]MUZ82827.1 GNAT family N-acetyltransferase [Agrobacterium vitis]MVA11797.1 GNAT family N-acetyltransferase [Agrobacterium vitis]
MTEDSDITLPRPTMVSIRNAQPGDLPELNEMIAALAAHHGDASDMTPQTLKRDLFGPMPWITALVADGGEQLIGYAILMPLYRANEGKRGMEMLHLYVRDGQRGNGIGHHLIARARDVARQSGCDYLSVSAATGNFAAHRFYEQMDFSARPVTGMRYIQALA